MKTGKTSRIKAVAVLVALLIAMALVPGTGFASDSDPVVGRYTLASMSMSGITLTAEQMAGMGTDVSGFVLEINADGTAALTMNGESAKAGWAKRGNTYALTAGSDTMDMEYNAYDETLTIEIQDASMGSARITFTKGQQSAEKIYVHPSGAYGFTVPDGWYIVDHDNIAQVIAQGLLVNQAATQLETIFSQDPGKPITFLRDASCDPYYFANAFRVITATVDDRFTLTTLIDAARGPYEAEAWERDPQANILVPFQATTYGDWEAATFAYEWTRDDGGEFVQMYVIFLNGSTMYEISLDCKPDAATRCGAVLETLAASFFIP